MALKWAASRGCADVGVDFRSEAAAETAGLEAGVVDVGAYGHCAGRHPLPQDFGIDAFVGGDGDDRRRDLARAGELHLRCHENPFFLLKIIIHSKIIN